MNWQKSVPSVTNAMCANTFCANLKGICAKKAFLWGINIELWFCF